MRLESINVDFSVLSITILLLFFSGREDISPQAKRVHILGSTGETCTAARRKAIKMTKKSTSHVSSSRSDVRWLRSRRSRSASSGVHADPECISCRNPERMVSFWAVTSFPFSKVSLGYGLQPPPLCFLGFPPLFL